MTSLPPRHALGRGASLFWRLAVSLGAVGGAAAQEAVLAEITVSAEASAFDEQRAAVTQKVIIDRAAIDATGGLTVGEVLGKLPGVDASVSSSDGSVNLRSRGMARESVQLLVDGERPASSSKHAMLIVSRMPAGELERVEIMKGASAEFGNAAPVTINLVTGRSRRKSGLTLKASAGTRDGEPIDQFSLTHEGSSGPWSWSLPLSLSEYRTPLERSVQRQNHAGGTRTLWQNDSESGRNDFAEQYFAPKLNWREGSSSFNVWPMFYRASGDRSTVLERTQYADAAAGTGLATVLKRDDHEDSSHRINRLRIDGETLVAGSKWSGRLALMDGRRDSEIVRRVSSGSEADSGESRRRDESEVNAALRVDRGWSEHVGSAGVEYVTLRRSEWESSSGSIVDSGNYRSDEQVAALWLQDEWAVAAPLTLTSGMRVQSIALASDGDSRRHGACSPSLAARWEIDERWLLRSSIGAAIKAPTLDEISDAPIRSTSVNSPLEPDRRGNPDLQPERSVGFELGVEHYWPNDAAVVGVNGYLRSTDNFTERRPVLEGTRWVERPYNEGNAQHWGIEVDVKLKTDAFGLRGGALRAHFTDPRARVDDRRLGITRNARELPRYIVSAGYDQALPALASSAGFSVQRTGDTRTSVADEQWAVSQARTVVDAYWVRKLDRTTNLRVSLQNLLGEDLTRIQRYWSAGQEWQLGSNDGQPRTLLVTIEGKW